MATLEEGLISYLEGYSGLTALVSTRIYHMTKPQSLAYPCVTLQRIDTPFIHTMQSSGATGNLISPRFQFDAWAATYSAAKAITDQLRAALNGKTGSIGTAPYSVTIRSSLQSTERPSYDVLVSMYRSMTEFVIMQED
jgi:hypothetical protein